MLKDKDLHIDKKEAANYSLFIKLPTKLYLDLKDPVFKFHIKLIESEDIYLAKYLPTSKDQEPNPIESDDELMQIETFDMPFANRASSEESFCSEISQDFKLSFFY